MLIKKIKSSAYLFFLVFIFCLATRSVTALELASGDVTDYILREDFWLQDDLAKIFSQGGSILKNSKTFEKAGFTILYNQPSGMQVARHPFLPGYLVKAYFQSNPKSFEFQWLVDRCQGAENVRNLIKQERLSCFVVPEKWIYFIPNQYPLMAILLVKDMKLVSKEKTKLAWKNASTREVKELYTILSHGFASCYLLGNMPRTKAGKFACIDTAIPYREHHYEDVRKYLSRSNQEYWDNLVREGETK